MTSLTRSWSIFKKSFALISSYKKLLLFPAISFFFILLLILLILAGGLLLVYVFPEISQQSQQEKPDLTVQIIVLVVYFLFYLLTMFVSTFSMTAFYHGIYCGLNGEPVALDRSFSFALSRWNAIFLWSLLASTVGIFLKFLENKSSFIGKFIIRIIGLMWAVAACFAIPVLVIKTDLKSPIAVLKYSVGAIKKTWGEALIGFAGIRILSFFAALIWILGTIGIAVLCTMAKSFLCWLAGGFLMAILFFGFFIFAYLIDVAHHVYTASLFRYAECGDPGLFSQEELEAAFKHKKG